MKVVWATILLAASAALAGSPADVSGKWNLKSTWPNGPGLKTVGAVILELQVDGATVTGMAHIGSWPGDAPIAEGRFKGNGISFDATGHLESSTGIPTCHFQGTVVDGQMMLEMTMTRNPAASGTFVFKGSHQPE